MPDVRSVAVVGLPPAEVDMYAPMRWVVVLDVERPERWLSRIGLGLSRLAFGETVTEPLPASKVETPVGQVDLLGIPRTRVGIAWQVRDSCIVWAWGVDTLVDYLTLLRQQPVGYAAPTDADRV